MKMNLSNRTGPVTLQLLRTPNGVKAVFNPKQDDRDLDPFSTHQPATEEVALELPGQISIANDQLLTLRKLAGDLYDTIELEGARLGWTASQITAFQAPVERIREVAQRALVKRQD